MHGVQPTFHNTRFFFLILKTNLAMATLAGMLEAGGQWGQLPPPQILADQKALPCSGHAPHYYLPPQIFRLCNMPVYTPLQNVRHGSKDVIMFGLLTNKL